MYPLSVSLLHVNCCKRCTPHDTYSEVQEISLCLDFRRDCSPRILDLLEKIVQVVETLALLHVVTFHRIFVQRIRVQGVADLFGNRTRGEEDRSGTLI